MRHLKNIFRLPGVYLPLLLSLALATVLQLISLSVISSCDSSAELAEKSYTATVDLTLTERKVRVEDPDRTSGYSIINENTSVIDRNMLELVSSCSNVTDVDYLSLKCEYDSFFCSYAEQKRILNAVESGEEFNTAYKEYTDYLRYGGQSYFTVYTDPALIYEADSGIQDIVFLCDPNEEGIILTESAYKKYGCPEKLIYGWFDFKIQAYATFENGEYVFKHSWVKDAFHKALKEEHAEPLEVKVIGYYTTSSVGAIPYCSEAMAEKIYNRSFAVDYTVSDKEHDLIKDTGIAKIRLTLSSASKVLDVMAELEEKGLDYNDYQLYAHDYDYKFAMAQIENVRNFTVVLYYASAVFSVLISIILVCYSVKKHSSEIYILRSLGESRMKIALGITAESFVICLSAVILGTLLCSVLGSAVCDAVNAYTFERASHAAESLSEAAEFMRNSDTLKAQLQSAIHSFESVGYRISYRSPGKKFVFFPCLIAVLTLLTLVLSAVAVNKNMMKREV